MLITPVFAHGGESHTNLPQPEEIVQELLKTQNISSLKDIDCSQIPSATLEKLGDAVMEQNHPGAMHERMDAMMGGEGSESLKQMHIAMGEEYLGCNISQTEAKTLKKFNQEMPDNMMGVGQSDMYNMMNSWFPTFSLTLQILTIALLIVLVRYFWKKGNK